MGRLLLGRYFDTEQEVAIISPVPDAFQETPNLGNRHADAVEVAGIGLGVAVRLQEVIDLVSVDLGQPVDLIELDPSGIFLITG